MRTRFLVKKGDTYYLTTGRLLEYNRHAAKTDAQRKGVEQVERDFDRIRNAPHTWYESVEICDSDFSPINTGQTE
jgi:hypothetical protein